MTSPQFLFLLALLLLAIGLPGKDYALFFAVEDYEHMTPLTNPIDNATAIADELRDNYGFQIEVVPNPTFAEIAGKIQEYQQRFASGTYDQKGQLLIFFSGHGLQRGNNGYFIPKDGNPSKLYERVIEYDYWRNEIDQIACQHILVTVDACHSLTFDPNWRNKTDRNFGRRGDQTKDQVRLDHAAYRARLFFTSDGINDQTPDRSTLARQFLKGLRTHRSTNGYFSASELYAGYLKVAAPVPGGGDFGKDEPGSRFLFFRKSTGPHIDPQDQRAWDYAQSKGDLIFYQEYIAEFPAGFYRNEAERVMNDFSSLAKSKVAGKFSRENMVYVKGGVFQMGDQLNRGTSNEKPVHAVSVSDFYLGKTELTNQQFVHFLNEEGNLYQGGTQWYGIKSEYAGIRLVGDEFSLKKGYENHPVLAVSWYGALAYCNWLSEMHGLVPVYYVDGEKVTVNWKADGYRLPTEAEWEYAAKSMGRAKQWSGTSKAEDLIKFANYASMDDGFRRVAPVGEFKANELGLMDMSGNVWEWCWDGYSGGYYKRSDFNDPKGSENDSKRIIRGGGWYSSSLECRTTKRTAIKPRYRRPSVGFRLARNAN